MKNAFKRQKDQTVVYGDTTITNDQHFKIDINPYYAISTKQIKKIVKLPEGEKLNNWLAQNSTLIYTLLLIPYSHRF